jgi:hypothetical protein
MPDDSPEGKKHRASPKLTDLETRFEKVFGHSVPSVGEAAPPTELETQFEKVFGHPPQTPREHKYSEALSARIAQLKKDDGRNSGARRHHSSFFSEPVTAPSGLITSPDLPLDCHSITAAEAVLTLGEIRKHFLPSEPTGAIAAIEQIHASLEGGGLEDGIAKLTTLAEQLSTLAQRVTDLREELLDTENSIQEARFDNLRR